MDLPPLASLSVVFSLWVRIMQLYVQVFTVNYRSLLFLSINLHQLRYYTRYCGFQNHYRLNILDLKARTRTEDGNKGHPGIKACLEFLWGNGREHVLSGFRRLLLAQFDRGCEPSLLALPVTHQVRGFAHDNLDGNGVEIVILLL